MLSIAIKSLRSKWRDYTVLFIGLVIAVAIFYMFSALALNKDFLTANASFKMIAAVFMVGEFLLGVITFVYLNFANGLLLRLRQAEYGLMSMLGAKKSQIGLLLMQETVLLGAVATIIGIIIGMGFTSLAGNYLMSLLDVKLASWSVIVPGAIIATIVFFIALFILNGLYNQLRLVRQDTLTLLSADQSVKQPKLHKVLDTILGIVGLGLLVFSYILMPHIATLGLSGLVFILVINVLGTYWLLSRTLKFVTYAIKGSNFSQHGLRSFLNGQLLFRLPEYQRMLTAISVIFALALGAMSVGQGFYQAVSKQVAMYQPFTMAVTAKNSDISSLKKVTRQNDYQYAIKNNTVYFAKDNLNDVKVPTVVSTTATSAKIELLSGDQIIAHGSSNQTLIEIANQILNKQYGDRTKFVSAKSDLDKIGKVQTVKLVTVKSLEENNDVLEKLAKAETASLGTDVSNQAGSYNLYVRMKSVYGGLEFMGIFLGIAFMAMLASTLMFKVLSGVETDKRRYRILSMVGISPRTVTITVAKDLGILFFIPMIIGILDVVFGLKMFTELMAHPYGGFAMSLVSMVALYLVYYLLTVILYRRLIK